jgi:hypothetical protein
LVIEVDTSLAALVKVKIGFFMDFSQSINLSWAVIMNKEMKDQGFGKLYLNHLMIFTIEITVIMVENFVAINIIDFEEILEH